MGGGFGGGYGGGLGGMGGMMATGACKKKGSCGR